MNMASIFVLQRAGLLLCILQWTQGHLIREEPIVYSRFDYESKLLERMVMVEHRMNLLEESTEKELDSLHKEKQTLEETVLRLKQQLEEEQANKIEQLDQLSQSLVKNVSSQLGNMSKLTEHLKEEQGTVLADALMKLDLKANTTIQDIYDKTVKPAVVFHMRLSSTSSSASPGPNALVKFDSAVTNTDDVYDTGTGYFTAPTAGVYMFAVQICGYRSKYINIHLYVNSNYITDTTQYDTESNYHCTSTNAAAVLEKGDTVCVKTGQNTSPGTTIRSSIYRRSTFTGTLVQ